MTARDLSAWSAVYAVAYVHGASTVYAGHVGSDERARQAVAVADRAVAALQQLRPETLVTHHRPGCPALAGGSLAECNGDGLGCGVRPEVAGG